MIFFLPCYDWLGFVNKKKLKANYLLYSQCSTLEEWLMIDQWLAVKATKFIIKKSTSCHWIQRMICVNLGFFSEKRLYVVNILSSGYEMYSTIYKDIYWQVSPALEFNGLNWSCLLYFYIYTMNTSHKSTHYILQYCISGNLFWR